jgi:hypothetical protein
MRKYESLCRKALSESIGNKTNRYVLASRPSTLNQKNGAVAGKFHTANIPTMEGIPFPQ